MTMLDDVRFARPSATPPVVLHGRTGEVAEIDLLLQNVRAGRSGVLAIRGDLGMGKTALATHAAYLAGDFVLLRASGAESEAELPYSALHQLLRPHLHHLDALPEPQADALQAAFGLRKAGDPDAYLVGLATLTLLSKLAAEGPLLCLLDDADRIDRATAATLMFIGRRLSTDRIALITTSSLTAQTPDAPGIAGLPELGAELRLDGLDRAAASEVLRDHSVTLTHHVRERVLDEAHGNPLALIELASALSTEQRIGLLPPLPLAVVAAPNAVPVQERFSRQFAGLPSATDLMVLIAAAEGTGRLEVILRAGQQLGGSLADLAPAEEAELIRLTEQTVTFRHPLIRPAAYRRATIMQRIAVHQALAEALGAVEDDADHRAWHLAACAMGPDEKVAAALERAAARAGTRAGYAVSSAGYERSAALSADLRDRCRRLAAASRAALRAGQLSRASKLADQADKLSAAPDVRADLVTVHAGIEFGNGRPRAGYELLLMEAKTLAQHNPERASRMVFDAVWMACFTADPVTIDRALPIIDTLPIPDGHPAHPLLTVARTISLALTGTPAAALPPLTAAVRAARAAIAGDAFAQLQAATLSLMVGDKRVFEETSSLAETSRATGQLGVLPYALLLNAQAAVALGRLTVAHEAANEGLRVADDTRQEQPAVLLRAVLAMVAAATGDDDRCMTLAEDALRHSAARRGGPFVEIAAWAMCMADVGRGRYEAALDRVEQAHLLPHHPLAGSYAPSLQIEAAVRVGQQDLAAALLAEYDSWVERHCDSPLLRAIVRRCHALVGSDGDVEHDFLTAGQLTDAADSPFEQARTDLLHGEWLRRQRRKSEARGKLRSALRSFELCGASAWADRARSELRAAGESVEGGQPDTPAADLLTPQELQVARLAATGLTNRDIGAKLYLSPRTVGYHLYKVYPKLGITGRHELMRIDLG